MIILVGYNAAANRNKEGLRLALKQAQAFNAEVVILASLMIGDKGHAFDLHAMDDAKKSFEAAGIACTTEILVRGRQPREDIVQYAKENQIDLIIIGVRIRSRVGKLLLGSTA